MAPRKTDKEPAAPAPTRRKAPSEEGQEPSNETEPRQPQRDEDPNELEAKVRAMRNSGADDGTAQAMTAELMQQRGRSNLRTNAPRTLGAEVATQSSGGVAQWQPSEGTAI